MINHEYLNFADETTIRSLLLFSLAQLINPETDTVTSDSHYLDEDNIAHEVLIVDHQLQNGSIVSDIFTISNECSLIRRFRLTGTKTNTKNSPSSQFGRSLGEFYQEVERLLK